MLLRQKRPFYAFMITMSSHTPFNLPAGLRRLDLDPALDASHAGGYLESIHYVDEHLGILLKGLEADGLLANTLVAIYGDHLGVHRYHREEAAGFRAAYPWYQNDARRVPLILLHPSLKPASIVLNGGETDIMPTLMALLGLPDPAVQGTAMGRNLLASSTDLALLGDGSLVGSAKDPRVRAHLQQGLGIADLVIRGNYFRNPQP
jgi:phosphoglycerol transferase MdoB-like AlkP superfamily enzyme